MDLIRQSFGKKEVRSEQSTSMQTVKSSSPSPQVGPSDTLDRSTNVTSRHLRFLMVVFHATLLILSASQIIMAQNAINANNAEFKISYGGDSLTYIIKGLSFSDYSSQGTIFDVDLKLDNGQLLKNILYAEMAPENYKTFSFPENPQFAVDMEQQGEGVYTITSRGNNIFINACFSADDAQKGTTGHIMIKGFKHGTLVNMK
jgi:hypothetical protein